MIKDRIRRDSKLEENMAYGGIYQMGDSNHNGLDLLGHTLLLPFKLEHVDWWPRNHKSIIDAHGEILVRWSKEGNCISEMIPCNTSSKEGTFRDEDASVIFIVHRHELLSRNAQVL